VASRVTTASDRPSGSRMNRAAPEPEVDTTAGVKLDGVVEDTDPDQEAIGAEAMLASRASRHTSGWTISMGVDQT
jgi:hypothetical protein